MYTIKTFNKIKNLLGADFTLDENAKDYDAIMVRSADLKEETFSKNCRAIARVGAGVNNIPIDKCTELGIAVFNTPGGNANAVKELTICGIIGISRNIKAAGDWLSSVKNDDIDLSKTVEKEKSKYVGNEILGKTLGVIGLGQVGGKVAKVLHNLGMNAIGYDAYLSPHQKQDLKQYVEIVDSIDTILEKSDYISLHMATTNETKGFVNKSNIEKMKDGVSIVNYARGELVKHEDLIEALKSGKVKAYATDFPTKEELALPNVLATPHLGASTVEAEDNCAAMAASEMKEFLTNGNIENSVNFPNVTIARSTGARVTVLHKNKVGMLEQITNKIADFKLNIEGLANKGRNDIAYTILDFSGEVPENIESKIREIPD
ncbi:MAG: 3-phosphoglycerate dehydrogenase, partial [Lachnospiraceae bacterium]|nr:3-phosphoglycerate dehydrogenase [Lachnospiraceae bacterium]